MKKSTNAMRVYARISAGMSQIPAICEAEKISVDTCNTAIQNLRIKGLIVSGGKPKGFGSAGGSKSAGWFPNPEPTEHEGIYVRSSTWSGVSSVFHVGT